MRVESTEVIHGGQLPRGPSGLVEFVRGVRRALCGARELVVSERCDHVSVSAIGLLLTFAAVQELPSATKECAPRKVLCFAQGRDGVGFDWQ